jgi:hypothetical protein
MPSFILMSEMRENVLSSTCFGEVKLILCLSLLFQDSFDLDMDFSKTKKKKKTKKKDLDEFIAEDEKKKAEDKENGNGF